MTILKFDKLKFEKLSCPNGCSNSDRKIIIGKDTLHELEGTFTIVRCNNCGLSRTSPRPDQKSVGYYYPDNYRPYSSATIMPSSKGIWKSIRTWVRNNVSGKTTDYLPANSSGRLLEIGCSTGKFLNAASNLGWQVEGVEFSKIAARHARAQGHQVIVGQLETVELPANSYDVVVGWMVLEHLHNPSAVLSHLYMAMKPNGVLILSVPNFNSWSRRIFGQFWYGLQLPTHLFHFTEPSLRKTLEKKGFINCKFSYQANIKDFVLSLSIFLKNKGYIRFSSVLRNMVESAGLKIHLFYPVAALAAVLKGSSRMVVVVRKPH